MNTKGNEVVSVCVTRNKAWRELLEKNSDNYDNEDFLKKKQLFESICMCFLRKNGCYKIQRNREIQKMDTMKACITNTPFARLEW